MSNTTVNQAIINCVYVNRTEKTAILKIDFMGQWLLIKVLPKLLFLISLKMQQFSF